MADEEPLNEQQLKVLADIVKLPQPDQQRELQRFLKTLKPEQIAWLKKQQAGGGSGGCVFCGIASGKVQSKSVFENTFVVAVLDIHPAAKGHVLIIPKKHVEVLWDLAKEELHSVMEVTSTISKEVAEVTSADGVNVFVAVGEAAGQRVPHVVVHVIPRFEKDTVAFQWDSVEVPDAEMNEVRSQLVGRLKVPEPVIEQKIEEIPGEVERERIP